MINLYQQCIWHAVKHMHYPLHWVSHNVSIMLLGLEFYTDELGSIGDAVKNKYF